MGLLVVNRAKCSQALLLKSKLKRRDFYQEGPKEGGGIKEDLCTLHRSLDRPILTPILQGVDSRTSA